MHTAALSVASGAWQRVSVLASADMSDFRPGAGAEDVGLLFRPRIWSADASGGHLEGIAMSSGRRAQRDA